MMYSIIIFFLCITTINNALLGFSFKNIQSQVNSYVSSIASPFKSYKAEKVIEEQYAVKNPGTLFIALPKGDITIKSEWEKEVVYVKASIKTHKEEDLEKISLDPVHQSRGHKTDLTIASAVGTTKEAFPYYINYELIVPKKMSVRCCAAKGSISILEASEPLYAKTEHGNITINNARSSIEAVSSNEGNIVISNAQGPINAQANKGNISIEHADNTIVAYAKKGTVKTSHGSIAPTSAISLASDSGNVIIALPTSTPAMLKGKTEHGTVYSQHYVTLKSRTTKLDNKSWNNFRKDIDGMLGSPTSSHDRLAKIELNTIKGNIKILDNSITT